MLERFREEYTYFFGKVKKGDLFNRMVNDLENDESIALWQKKEIQIRNQRLEEEKRRLTRQRVGELRQVVKNDEKFNEIQSPDFMSAMKALGRLWKNKTPVPIKKYRHEAYFKRKHGVLSLNYESLVSQTLEYSSQNYLVACLDAAYSQGVTFELSQNLTEMCFFASGRRYKGGVIASGITIRRYWDDGKLVTSFIENGKLKSNGSEPRSRIFEGSSDVLLSIAEAVHQKNLDLIFGPKSLNNPDTKI
jgi:hypothetical protein